MTYEPGTADILTTGDVPFPPDAENAVLRTIFERAAREGLVIGHWSGRWYLEIGAVRLTDDERHILAKIARATR